MLEPILRPRTGRALWVAAAVAGAIIVAMDSMVVTRFGTYSMTLGGIVLVALAGIRIIGITIGLRHGLGGMPWGFRIVSWIVFLGPLLAIGLLASPTGLAIAGAIVALDAVGGFLAPKADREVVHDPRFLQRLKVPLLVGVGLVLFAIFHVVWASRVEGGELLDWAFLSALFAVVVRYSVLPARRGPEEAALPPPEARRHETRNRPLDDPSRDAVLKAVGDFRRSGRVEPVIRYVDGFGVADLAEEARALLNRPGTRREDDLAAVADLLERRLAEPPSTRKVPIR